MVLLIDANVILDYFLVRRPHFNKAHRLLTKCLEPSVKGCVSFHSMSIISYVLRKHPDEERKQALYKVTDLLTVVSASHNAVVYAIGDKNFSDFEDCLQEKCALNINSDYIVTNNVKDFSASEIPAVTPAELLEIIHSA